MNHLQAKELVESALPELTPAESLFLRANAWLETRYGRGWKGEGAGSHNWGAVTMKSGPGGTCPGGFPHKDSRYDNNLGKVVEYTTCFRSYPDDMAGAKHMAKVLLKDNVRQQLASGNLYGGSAAMRENSYYLGTQPTVEQSIAVHHRTISSIVDKILAGTGEPNPFVPEESEGEPEPPSSSDSPDTSSTGPFVHGEVELPNLRWGNCGPAVGLWQRILGSAYWGEVDEDFGPLTHAATCDWQAGNHLKPDGWVGPLTWKSAP